MMLSFSLLLFFVECYFFRGCLSRRRIDPDRAWASSCSMAPKRSMTPISRRSADLEYFTRLLRRMKLEVSSPLKLRALDAVGSTCDGPAQKSPTGSGVQLPRNMAPAAEILPASFSGCAV